MYDVLHLFQSSKQCRVFLQTTIHYHNDSNDEKWISDAIMIMTSQIQFSSLKSGMYGQPSDINRTLIGNKIVNH